MNFWGNNINSVNNWQLPVKEAAVVTAASAIGFVMIM